MNAQLQTSVSSTQLERASFPATVVDRAELRLNSSATLCVVPRHTESWDNFISSYPSLSIALDGFVSGPTHYDLLGLHVNLNHHEDVNRIATRSTVEQTEIHIKVGLLDRFKREGLPAFRLYVNDADEDVCLSTWVLANYERVAGVRSEPAINKLIKLTGLLDATAGAFPMPSETRALREMAWIYEPYRTARAESKILNMSASEMISVIESVHGRINRFVLGDGNEIALDTRYEVLHSGSCWKLVHETGPYARTALFAEGIRSFVSFRGEANGGFHYSIGKISPFIEFPLTQIYTYLNTLEHIDPNSQDRWGGSDTIGGSPRKNGSTLRPEALTQAIEQAIQSIHKENFSLLTVH